MFGQTPKFDRRSLLTSSLAAAIGGMVSAEIRIGEHTARGQAGFVPARDSGPA